MSCVPCFLTKVIQTCIEELTIGEVEASTDYDVYLVNNNTGYTIKRAVSSDGSGLLVVDLAEVDSSFFSPNFKYKIHACLSGDPIVNAVDIIVQGMEEAV